MAPIATDPVTKPRILLVGTVHEYQKNMRGWNKKCGAPQFKQAMEQIVAEHGVDYLLEEMNPDALKNGCKRASSWLEVIAKERGIPHSFIDPNTMERQRLGIPSKGAMSPEEHDIRERFWLNRVCACSFKAALCVIGAAHVKTFSGKLEDNYNCTVVIPRYDPNSILVN